MDAGIAIIAIIAAGIIFILLVFGAGVLLWFKLQRSQQENLSLIMERFESEQHKLFSGIRTAIEHEKSLAIVTAFSTMLSQSLEVGQVIEAAISMVKEVMKVEVVLIFSLNKDTEELDLIAYEGVDRAYASTVGRMKLGEGFCGRVASTGRPLVIKDISNDLELGTPEARGENLKAQISVPLQSRGKIIGTLCAATRTTKQFNHDEIELLIAMGNLVGIAMENSQLYQEKLAAAYQHKRSEEKYRQLFENAQDAIWVQDLSGNITAANNAAAELYGYILHDLIGMSSRELLTQEGFELSREVQDKLLQGSNLSQPYTQKLIKRNGDEAILRVTTNITSNNGYPDGFQFIARDRTKEKRMQDNQGFYLEQITKAHEEERLRIARELHDCAAQSLIAVLHQMQNFCESDRHLPPSRLELIRGSCAQLKDVLQEIRQMSRDLRPSILDDFGLLPAVEWLTEQIRSEHKVAASLVVSGEEKRFPSEVEVTMFRIVQEALRNIVRHANATMAQVTISFSDTETEMTIADNGKGFDVPVNLGELSRLGKLGIDGMYTRTRLIGGSFSVKSSPGEGTVIVVSVPV